MLNQSASQIAHLAPRQDTANISRHELARLIESDRMLSHLIAHCTYLEDGAGPSHCWSSDDEDRKDMTLREYLTRRVAGETVPEFIEADEPEICGQCNGSGEGMYDGSRCSRCHGTGAA